MPHHNNLKFVLYKTVAPRITLEPGPTYALSGQDKTLPRCLVTGYPLPNVSWSRGLGELSVNRTFVQGGQLTIRKVKPSDFGRYICTASNVLGSKKAVTMLSVLLPPRFTTKPPANLSVTQGDTVRVGCRARGVGGVVVSWRRENKSLPLGRTEQPKGVLILKNVTPKDSGKYVCVAAEHHALSKLEKDAEMHLTVKGVCSAYFLHTGSINNSYDYSCSQKRLLFNIIQFFLKIHI